MFLSICGGVLIFSITFISILKAKKKKKEYKKYQSIYNDLLRNNNYYGPRIWSPFYSFPNDHQKAEEVFQQQVLDMPQLTFSRWLTFYNNSPEAWVIQKDETKRYANIPYYVKTTQHEDKRGHIKDFTTYLPIFWTDPYEMKLYREWVENEYEKGKAAVYQKTRDEHLQELVGYLSDDLKAQREKIDAEINQAKQEAIEYHNKAQESSNISLQLSDGTIVNVKGDKI